jgi:hypothetical protein
MLLTERRIERTFQLLNRRALGLVGYTCALKPQGEDVSRRQGKTRVLCRTFVVDPKVFIINAGAARKRDELSERSPLLLDLLQKMLQP